ncbi:MAG: Acyl-CoA dehydrogenase C-terminal domain-containing protein, partial [Thermoleophilia bacterium]|nr:Acyl-CoA dehydrogenase C-terminal domain-containing protein [Thermoleophilia bacterium]
RIAQVQRLQEAATAGEGSATGGRAAETAAAGATGAAAGLAHLAVDDPAATLKELRAELKRMNRLAGLYTPMAKACCTEMANQVTYDSLQVHGGSGYMRDFAVERHSRDARITNIYEGTTQLQVVAAIGGVLSGTLADRLDEYEAGEHGATPELFARVAAARARLQAAVERVRELDDARFRDYHARRLVEMAIDVICGYLLVRDAQHDARRLLAARHFVAGMTGRVEGAAAMVLAGDPGELDVLSALTAD